MVADDHKLFRVGLVRMLNSFEGIRVVNEAASGAEILDLIEHVAADVLILDLSMPGVSGVSLIEKVRQAMPDLPILILSMHDEPALVRQVLQCGVKGYITKNADPEILSAAVGRLAEGGRYLAQNIAESLAFGPEGGGSSRSSAALSARELEVLRLLAQDGLSLVQIAERLDLSPKTITTHKSNIMTKLGVANNSELIRYVIDRSLFA
ncbi:MAG: response regulator transcription factor [Rhodocyclaceae bacterium]|nr:response regulator transcription factor [Rhodocyclaceae bacterium]